MYPLETGGVLIGWYSQGQYVVTASTGPGPKASHKRNRFQPDGEYRNAKVLRRFDQSSGAEVYLGDWHTHPDQSAVAMSWLDKHELGRIAGQSEARDKPPIMIILAGRDSWSADGWRCCSLTAGPAWLRVARTESAQIRPFGRTALRMD